MNDLKSGKVRSSIGAASFVENRLQMMQSEILSKTKATPKNQEKAQLRLKELFRQADNEMKHVMYKISRVVDNGENQH